jgi:hypothetical protein
MSSKKRERPLFLAFHCPWSKEEDHDHGSCYECQGREPLPRETCGCCVSGCGDCPGCYSYGGKCYSETCDRWKWDPAQVYRYKHAFRHSMLKRGKRPIDEESGYVTA